MDNPHKNPIIILKDVRGWEVQCIVDFMYKGETSVPEAQLTGLIKAAEGLKVRGLTSSDQVPRNSNLHVDTTSPRSRHSSPMTSSVQGLAINGYHHGVPPPSHHAPTTSPLPLCSHLPAHPPSPRRRVENRGFLNLYAQKL